MNGETMGRAQEDGHMKLLLRLSLGEKETCEWRSAGDLYLRNWRCSKQHTCEYYRELIPNLGELRS